MHADSMNPIRAVLVGAAEESLIAAESELRAAQLSADVGTLARLIDDDLLFTGPDGSVGSKAQDLEAHRSGLVRFRSHAPEELRVRPLGADVAITALRARLAVEVGGTLVEGVYRYTRVWARGNEGRWRVVGGHVSAVPPASG